MQEYIHELSLRTGTHFLERKVRPPGAWKIHLCLPLGLKCLILVQPSPSSGTATRLQNPLISVYVLELIHFLYQHVIDAGSQDSETQEGSHESIASEGLGALFCLRSCCARCSCL